MTKGFNKLTEKEQRALDNLIKEITEEAKHVVEGYKESPSEISGSIVQVHEDSPYLTEKKDRLIKINKKKP